MTQDQFNEMLRNIFTDLLDNGYKKSAICQRVLGSHRQVQFESFMKNTDLGIKPLSKMMENFGYELHLVPVKKDDVENLKQVEKITEEFTEYASITLNESLLDSTTNRKTQTTQAAESIVESVLT